MRLGISHGSGTAYAFFTDATGEVCMLSETTANWPAVMLGWHHHKMMLRVGHVRELLPLLHRFAHTGQLLRPLEEDYQI